MSSTEDKGKHPLIINATLDWNNWGLSNQARSIRLVKDEDGNIWATPTLSVLINKATNQIEIQRTPTIFRIGLFTTGAAVAVWTPTAGKRFRMLGGILTLTKDAAAAAGPVAVSILDGVASIYETRICNGALIASDQVTVIPLVLPGNGYLSLAIGNTLDVYCTQTLTAGAVSAFVWGCEE